jgi:hypothetical protein
VQYVQSRLVSIIDGKDGVGVQTTKVHCPLHVDYLLDVGSYNNVHGGLASLTTKRISRNVPRIPSAGRLHLTSR